MISEEKQLLLKDLCARLPYGVKCDCKHAHVITLTKIDIKDLTVYYADCDEWEGIEDCKPYLHPISSMTEREKNECIGFSRVKPINGVHELVDFNITNPDFVDWLNAHHFDYRGLIEKRLALEAPEGIYTYK